MTNAKANVEKRWQVIFLLSLIFIVAIIIQDVVREVVMFRRDISVLEQEFFNDVKDDVHDLVTNVDEDFYYTIDNLHDLATEHTKENLEPLIFAANSITALHENNPLSEKQADIISLTQTYSIQDPEHVYHVYDTDGTLLYNGDTNQMVSIDMFNTVDEINRPYIQDMLTQIDSSATLEAVLTYYVEIDEEIEPFILYGKEIAGTNLIIVNEVQISHFNEKLKDEAIESLIDKNRDQTNSIYALSSEGEILYHQNPDAIGLSVDSDDYPIWAETLQIIVDFVDEDQEGYVEYPFYSNYQNGVIEQKMAYIKYIPEWEIIIGASASEDTYTGLIDQYVQDNYRTVMYVKLPSYIIIIILATIMFVHIRRNIGMAQSILHEEEHLYKTFADMTSEIIMITDSQGKIIFTNKQGQEIIYGERSNDDDVYFDQILVEEDGYYILYGVKNDLFVKYITEPIVFNNQPADLYIIANVTEKIMTERKLESLSMKDELTKLGNRRMMVQDYNNVIIPYVKDGGNAYLAMIDLDDFKPANDLYGHSFGDVVLQKIAETFIEKMNDKIKFYRIGGDEFAILFMKMEQEEVRQFLEELQETIHHYPYDKDVEVGFSGGIVRIEISDKRRRFSDFYDRADKLLYKSKADGKNTLNF